MMRPQAISAAAMDKRYWEGFQQILSAGDGGVGYKVLASFAPL